MPKVSASERNCYYSCDAISFHGRRLNITPELYFINRSSFYLFYENGAERMLSSSIKLFIYYFSMATAITLAAHGKSRFLSCSMSRQTFAIYANVSERFHMTANNCSKNWGKKKIALLIATGNCMTNDIFFFSLLLLYFGFSFLCLSRRADNIFPSHSRPTSDTRLSVDHRSKFMTCRMILFGYVRNFRMTKL